MEQELDNLAAVELVEEEEGIPFEQVLAAWPQDMQDKYWELRRASDNERVRVEAEDFLKKMQRKALSEEEKELRAQRAAAWEAQLEEWRVARLARLQEPFRKMGRPREVGEGPKKQLVVVFTEAQHAGFREYCNLRGLEMSKVVREFVEGLLGKLSGGMGGLDPVHAARYDQWLKYTKEMGIEIGLEGVMQKYKQLEVEQEGGNKNG